MESVSDLSSKGDARTATDTDFAEEENPFRINGLDDMIFTFKESEKNRKNAAR